jgi:ABC-2 type transport system permease protein
MSKTLLILRNEIITILSRRSFWLVFLLVPTFSLVLYYFIIDASFQAGGSSSQSANAITEFLLPADTPLPTGLVDLSGIIQEFPPDLGDPLQTYPSEADAMNALKAGQIKGYYVVPADYILYGAVTLVRPDFNPLSGFMQSGPVEWTLAYNLLHNNSDLTKRIIDPMEIEIEYINKQPERDPDDTRTFFVPYAVTILLYMVILGSSSMMLNSISSEKTNRVMEVLLTSATPLQILTGKLVGLGLVGLFQTLTWGVIGITLMNASNKPSASANFDLDPGIYAWGVAYFLFGYIIYASLMGGLGALAPNLRDAGSVTTIIMLPMILPMMLIGMLIQQPNSTVSLALSLFPLTSPVAMMTRLAATSVPLWQLLLSLALLVVTAFLVVRSAAGMFRAQHLLTNQPFKLKLFFLALIGKA